MYLSYQKILFCLLDNNLSVSFSQLDCLEASIDAVFQVGLKIILLDENDQG